MRAGIYTPLTGMLSEEMRYKAITDNIANVETKGYKRAHATFQSFENVLDQVGVEVREKANTNPTLVSALHRDFSDGVMKQTGKPLDVALNGQGFLMFESPEGQRLGRDGSLTLNDKGVLVDLNGNPVLGESGEIRIPENAENILINDQGVIFVDGQEIDRLRLVNVQDQWNLQPAGNNLFRYEGAGDFEEAQDVTVLQGFVEGSNVQVVKEMRDMVISHRLHDVNARALGAMDELTSGLLRLL